MKLGWARLGNAGKVVDHTRPDCQIFQARGLFENGVERIRHEYLQISSFPKPSPPQNANENEILFVKYLLLEGWRQEGEKIGFDPMITTFWKS